MFDARPRRSVRDHRKAVRHIGASRKTHVSWVRWDWRAKTGVSVKLVGRSPSVNEPSRSRYCKQAIAGNHDSLSPCGRRRCCDGMGEHALCRHLIKLALSNADISV